jgi:two-component system chemotaxis sensor kinase CheA
VGIDAHDGLKATFFAECDDLMGAVAEILGRLWPEGGEEDDIGALFRAVHSIKGGAGAFRLDALAGYAHDFETVLDAMRSGAVGLDQRMHADLLAAADGLSDLVDAAREGTVAATDRGGAALDALRARCPAASENAFEGFAPVPLDLDLAENGAEEPAETSWEIRLAPSRRFYELGNEPIWLFRALARLGRLEVMPDLSRLPDLDRIDPARPYLAWTARLVTGVPESRIRSIFEFAEGHADLSIAPADGASLTGAEGPRPPDEPPDEPPARRRAPPRPKASVRVDAERIDHLIAVAGELIECHGALARAVADAGLPETSPIAERVVDLLRLSRELQETAMTTRAQPIKALFQRMGRVAREAAATADRQVRLGVEGEGTEVDKTLLDALVEPLTQIVRNAVDHGIEPPGRRTAAGKSAEGEITLRAGHRASRLVVEIADDGAGIDRARVRDLARAQGLLGPGDAPDADAVDAAIFAPGLSTAAATSRLSGRGVGLDVVRATIASLGGQVAIRSTPGRGTTFTLSLPMTLTPVSGTLVAAGARRLVVPTTALVRIERPMHGQGQGSALADGTPLVDLRPPGRTGDGQAVVVARRDGTRVGLVVDDVEDHVQAVITGVDPDCPGLSFARLTSSGEAVRIVDPDDVRGIATGIAPMAAPDGGPRGDLGFGGQDDGA